MDIATLPIVTVAIADLEDIALRLERHAEAIDEIAARIPRGTSPSWRGEAADRHRELVMGHAGDLTSLATAMRRAATAVRVLSATAQERVALLQDAAEVAWTVRPVLVVP